MSEEDIDEDTLVTEHINNRARSANELADRLANMSKDLKAAEKNPAIKFKGPAAGQAIECLKVMTTFIENLATNAGRLSWNTYVEQAADAQKNRHP